MNWQGRRCENRRRLARLPDCRRAWAEPLTLRSSVQLGMRDGHALTVPRHLEAEINGNCRRLSLTGPAFGRADKCSTHRPESTKRPAVRADEGGTGRMETHIAREAAGCAATNGERMAQRLWSQHQAGGVRQRVAAGLAFALGGTDDRS